MDAKREPLAIRGAVVAAVTAVLHLLVIAGVLPLSAEVEGQAALVIDLLGTAVLVAWTRGHVTPSADPRDDQGRPLTPDVDSTPDSYTGRHRPPAEPTTFDQLNCGDADNQEG